MTPPASTAHVVGEVLAAATALLAEAGMESPDIEARALLAPLLNCSRSAVLLHRDDMIDDETVETYRYWVDRRLHREPVAYIVGVRNFMGYDYAVDPHVLIPRPETELLVEDALMEVRDRGLLRPRILDVGTGSGCIAIALALLLPEADIMGVDIDPAVVAMAEKNARKLGANVPILRSDLFTALPLVREGAFDMILANPPYIASPELSRLEPELFFEPRHALDGGPDGLAVLRRIIHQGRNYLKPGGLMALEIGHDQGRRVCDLLEANKFENIQILKDYSGLDRIAKGTKSGSV